MKTFQATILLVLFSAPYGSPSMTQPCKFPELPALREKPFAVTSFRRGASRCWSREQGS